MQNHRKTILFAGLMTFIGLFAASISPSFAEGIVSRIAGSPIFANGSVKNIRAGNNIHLQRADAMGDDFLDPAVIGYGIPAGGRMEIEMVQGYERDLNVPLGQGGILLVAGTPQQAITGRVAGYKVSEGKNPNTFLITPTKPEGMIAERLVAAAPAAAKDPIPQRGIKIIHVGRTMAFINRGDRGRVSVRIFDKNNKVIAEGSAETEFLPEPRPQILPTNVPDNKRNRNWQRIKPGQILGASEGTLPLSFLMFDKNEGFGNKGIFGAGVLSTRQLQTLDFQMPKVLERYNDGLILQDMNKDGKLDVTADRIIGGITLTAPDGATGHFATSPVVRGKPYLSLPTGLIDKRAGERPGGAIMELVFVGGSKAGKCTVSAAIFKDLNDMASGDGSAYAYTVVVE